ncbi:MAG: hypothetical protein QXK89_07485 [Candidatus Bathyarchaeia archaeon]|nr:hypothetical protein [Candidatus Bathyarchaeota archaeon]
MRADFLRKSVQRYYEAQGYATFFPKGGIHVGNGMIDGEVIERGIKIAVELKSDNDDILRGLGQLLEALAHGYDEALLVTSSMRSERLDIKVFVASGIGLAAVNSKGELKIMVEPKIVKF